METINKISEKNEKLLSYDSHSVLKTADRALDAKVEESTSHFFLKLFLTIFVLLIIFLLAYHFYPAVNIDNTPYVKIGAQKIKVTLAKTPQEQSTGLSGRASLGPDEGMLFIFENISKQSFWMKDMSFAIDIIWIGENKKVVFIKKNALPELYPEMYTPTQDAQYVLEVVSGFSDKNNLQIGDRVELVY